RISAQPACRDRREYVHVGSLARVRPPWMAGVQRLQEQIAALRASVPASRLRRNPLPRWRPKVWDPSFRRTSACRASRTTPPALGRVRPGNAIGIERSFTLNGETDPAHESADRRL